LTGSGGKRRESLRLRELLKSKIHRATVTDANLDYIGSITIDQDLLDKVDMWSGEMVHVWNITNGERFQTYALSGERGSGMVRINGAGAHKARQGDVVIVASFALSDEPIEPKAILVDADNRFVKEL
jgi:aspartate 1-decarboxylase